MNFVEIVETVEDIETKMVDLSEEKLGLLKAVLVEGSEIEFDVVHHIDHLVGFVDSYSDGQAQAITESVDCGKVLNIVLESVRKNASDAEVVLSEAVEAVGDMDLETVDGDSETVSIPLLTVVSNVLTEMTGEEAVEGMPAEMIFDIVNEAKDLDLVEDADTLDMDSLVSEISTKLEEAIISGDIDLDTEDYTGETMAEFLEDYDNTADILEEMSKVSEEVLAESDDVDGVRLLTKAKEATIMLEAQSVKSEAKGLEKNIEPTSTTKDVVSVVLKSLL